jgi:hypothetical protein
MACLAIEKPAELRQKTDNLELLSEVMIVEQNSFFLIILPANYSVCLLRFCLGMVSHAFSVL